MSQADQKVLPFSPLALPESTRTRPLKIHGAGTSSKLSPSSTARSDVRTIPESLLRRLRRLDAEQLQIIEIMAAAFERGVV